MTIVKSKQLTVWYASTKFNRNLLRAFSDNAYGQTTKKMVFHTKKYIERKVRVTNSSK